MKKRFTIILSDRNRSLVMERKDVVLLTVYLSSIIVDEGLGCVCCMGLLKLIAIDSVGKSKLQKL